MLFICLLVLQLLAASYATWDADERVDYTNHKIVRIEPENEKNLQTIVNLQKSQKVNILTLDQ